MVDMIFATHSFSLCLFPVLRPEQQIRGERGFAARHDRERVGLADGRQGGLEQGLDEGEGHLLRRERQLLRHGRQPPRQVLVPRVFPQRQVQGARASHGALRHLGRAGTDTAKWIQLGAVTSFLGHLHPTALPTHVT